MLFAEIREIKSSKKELKSFGVTMAVILGAIGLVSFWRGGAHAVYWGAASVFFLGAGLLAPAVLKPLQKAWLTLGLLMGALIAPVVLCAIYVLIVTPLGLVLRLSGKDLLDSKFPDNRDSYWIPHGPREKESYEKQF